MIYIGIDPGASGGIGVIDTIEDTAEVLPYTTETFINVLRRIGKMKVMVEHLQPMPKNGSIANFKLGEAFGSILGILNAYRVQHELVRPQTWKKEFHCTSDKNTSIECCKRLFPAVDLKRTEKCRKDDHNLAEALLIAEYARRRMK